MNYRSYWNQSWTLSIGAAVFLWLSFPPFNLGILQIPAFIFLMRIAVISESTRQMIYYAYPSFVLWNLLSTYWLMMATVAGGAAAIFANAALMLIPLWIIRKLFLSNINPVVASFFAASVWVSYEFLHHQWDLSWPWLTLGNGWSNLTILIQYISVTGVWGISFWVIFTASLFYHYFTKKSRQSLNSAILVFVAFPVFSVITLATVQQPEDRPLEVAIVQPNSDSYEDYGGHESMDHLVTHLLELSNSARTNSTELLLWPENALDSALTPDSHHISRIRDSLQVWNVDLITGTGYIKYYEDDQAPALIRGSHNQRSYNVYNAAFHVRDNQPVEIYEKGRLVPVVERFPFVEFFNKADLLSLVNWGSLMNYGLGREATVFDINGGRTPALICYDSVFPGWVNQFVTNGSDFLAIITNDGWWGDSHGHIQHFAYARLRAIEQRRWIARSANNGISGIISPKGKIELETEYWTEQAFAATIYRSDFRTIYNRFGDWLGWTLTLSSLAGIGIVFIRKRDL